jgi:hypothetical protein
MARFCCLPHAGWTSNFCLDTASANQPDLVAPSRNHAPCDHCAACRALQQLSAAASLQPFHRLPPIPHQLPAVLIGQCGPECEDKPKELCSASSRYLAAHCKAHSCPDHMHSCSRMALPSKRCLVPVSWHCVAVCYCLWRLLIEDTQLKPSNPYLVSLS